EFARAGRVEFERDDRLAGALIEAGLGVGKLLAGYDHPFFEQIRLPVFRLRSIDDFRLRRRSTLQGLLGRHGPVDQAERQLRSLAENVEQLLRIAEAGHLHQDTIVALALDRWFDQSQLVYALADDLDRLLHHLADALDDRRLGDGEPHQPAADVFHVKRTLAGGAEKPAERLRQFPELRQPLLQVVLANAHLDRVAANDRRAGQSHARLAQDLAHVVLHCQELLPPHVVGVDLEQDVRTALQVEAEHDVALRPSGPALDHAFGEEVGNGKQTDDASREQDRYRLPLRNVKHGPFRFARPLVEPLSSRLP